MFCMNCGQQLPDGAKFCLNCGTPQGAVSPTGNTQAETVNLDGMHTFVPAMCPNCNAHMKVDTSSKVARCDTCGTECLVQDAIKALSVRGNVQVGSATINVSGTNIESLLQRVEIMLGDGDFSGAMSKCDTILDSDPTNGRVYFFMLMSSLRCKSRIELANQSSLFDGNHFFLKAMKYGDSELKNELQGYINVINARNELKRNREESEAKRKQEENEAKRKREEEENEAKRKREEEENEAKLKNPKIGDIFYFGTFNGKRIYWKVLRIEKRMAFIISRDNITCLPYHQPAVKKITWANCTLRKWLNSDFINGSFSQNERARILPCKLNNVNNPEFKTPAGPLTYDNVFLLSINEANDLFANDQARANGYWWWLRSPGCYLDYAAFVNYSGEVNTRGYPIDGNGNNLRGVRPALWIKLDY